MKFQCSSCGLRIDSLHFKAAGLVNDALTSICDICRQRGLDPSDYPNEVVSLFAQSSLYAFKGAKQAAQADLLIKDQKVRKQYEAFLQDYDGNYVAQSQVSRADLNDAIIDSEDGVSFVPDNSLTFQENLERLGLTANFQFNEVDYIDRERIRAKYHYRCQYCGRRGTSVDHKDPVSLSQNNDLDNLILSCSECNKIKSSMPYDLFIKLNGQVKDLNLKLVKYENLLGTLKEELALRRRNLAAQVHLKGVVDDPELAALRKENKRLQDAVDSLASDYQNLISLRETHISNGWKLAKATENLEII